MRVVIDTNVFVGACIGRGAASRVIEACLDKSLSAYIGPSLLFEYRDVIAPPEPFRNARLDYEQRALLLRAYVSCCTWQEIHFTWRPNLPDEADNHVMELAFAANADMLVTLNIRDFARQELHFPRIAIVRPEQLIERMTR